MTEIYLHFLVSHYGLYANAPVADARARPVPAAAAAGQSFRREAQLAGLSRAARGSPQSTAVALAIAARMAG